MTVLNPAVCLPHFKPFRAGGVPDELKGYAQWVCWKLEQKSEDPSKKPSKIPYSPLSGRKSGSTEKFRNASWSDFDLVCKAYQSGFYGGVGFAVTEQDPFVVIDFDHCVTDGVIHSDALGWIRKLGGYAEISPSGTGVHIILRGKKPGDRCTNKKGEYEIEVYEKARFITITGHVIEDFSQVEENQDALSDFYYEKLHVAEPAPKPVRTPVDIGAIPDDDRDLINLILASKQGPKFDRLMSGDTSGYGNGENAGHSEADLALCMILAGWTREDPERMDRIFRSSGLMRPKWNRSAGECSYGELTIRNAIKRNTWVYEGKQAKTVGSENFNVVPISDAKKKKSSGSKKLRTCHISESAFQPDKPLFDERQLPWPSTGSYYHINPVTGDLHVGGSDTEPGEIIAQAPIWVHARAKNLHKEYSLVVKFFNYDHLEMTLTFPTALLSDVGGMLGKQLRALGMPMIAGKEKMVNRYIDQMAKWCSNTGWIAEKIGWFEGTNPTVFVMPNVILRTAAEDGQAEPEVFYQPVLLQDARSLTFKGTLQQWQLMVADKAKRNPLLLFGILAGLAGPMNKLAKGESGGFHFCGDTSCGKTAIAQAAASVWGDASDPQYMAEQTSIRKWKATVSGLEAYAQLHNDITLCLDEIGGTRPEDISEAIYLLTGGIPKGRSVADGGLKRQPTWHTLLISTGELTIEQVLRQAGQEQKGGLRHRLPDIRCDTRDFGVVYDPELTSREVRSEFVSEFKDNCSQYYGTAGPAFVSWILSQIQQKGLLEYSNELKACVKDYKQRLIADIPQLPSEGIRMINRLAIIGAAGLCASHPDVGILNISPPLIDDAVFTIRDLWLDNMDAHKSEAERTIEYFKHQVMVNFASFVDLTDYDAKAPYKILGYRNNNYIMVLTKAMDELCGMHPKSSVLRELEKNGMIKLGEVDKKTGKRRPDDKAYLNHPKFPGRPRCFHIQRDFFD